MFLKKKTGTLILVIPELAHLERWYALLRNVLIFRVYRRRKAWVGRIGLVSYLAPASESPLALVSLSYLGIK